MNTAIVAYDVYDRAGKVPVTSYSATLDVGRDPLDMAKDALKYHQGGYISARYNDGTSVTVYPKLGEE